MTIVTANAASPHPPPTARGYLAERLAALHPAYFALVMATGIVAIASHLFGLSAFARPLAWANLLLYPMLWLCFIARAWRFPSRMLADAANHARAPGFFTVVAATGVLGVQARLIHQSVSLATALWWICVLLWAACTYSIFALLTVRRDKPTLAEGINGGWLVAVVATQSVTVLGCALLDGNVGFLFALTCFWLGGGMLYLWIIGLIFYRYMFFQFSPADLMPPYWINMGAAAISTLSGALLARAVEGSATLGPLRPFVLGLTLMFWATATWWIPMLVVLGLWRHFVNRLSLRYDPLYWGLVFPLGMYAVCTLRLAEALGTPFLIGIAQAFAVAAISAWLLTFLGLAQRALYVAMLAARQVRGHRPEPSTDLAPQGLLKGGYLS